MVRFLFKQQKPRRFEFKPRFYNPTREYIQERIKLYEAYEAGDDHQSVKVRISAHWRITQRRKANYRANRNVLLIALILLALAALYLYG
ncbi:MAG: hypothetical protein Kow0075_08380 [Salibacteraceae bacterium]